MNGLKQTIAKLFATATETGTVEQVSAQAVVAAAEVDTTEDSTDAVPADPEEAPAPDTTEDSTDAVPADPEEAPAPDTTEGTDAVPASPAPEATAAPAATMAHIEVSALAEIQRKAAAYDGIHAEYTQLKVWHTAAQGGIGLGPDANMATEGKAKHVSAATQRAIEIAEAQAKYAQ